MQDKWSKFNEAVQNLIAMGVVGTYLYLIINNATIPIEMTGIVFAILFYFGFKAKNK